MPNIDPRQLKRIMDSMGIKSTELDASRVVIEGADMDIIVENPQVTKIDAKGSVSFQIQGDIKEVDKVKVQIDDDDIKLFMEKSGIDDPEKARIALEQANGDIAAALINLKDKEGS
ncbi:MAG: nascent polypeptide-associated complex protein [Candidatus Micrarchaeota archaeon]|nr:nascent polypeptide-associated complex protein [Candidatus Micrarchaeota archaeon]